MENKLKSYFIMYWYLRRTFSQRQDQNLWKEKEKEEKNVRICSPSLALKMRSFRKVLLLVLSGANVSLLPLTPPSDPWPLSFLCWTPTRRAVNHLQVPWGCHWVKHLAGGDQPQTSSPSPTEADQRLTLLHFWYSSSCVVSIPKCGMALRDAAHPLTTKGIASKHCLVQTPEL